MPVGRRPSGFVLVAQGRAIGSGTARQEIGRHRPVTQEYPRPRDHKRYTPSHLALTPGTRLGVYEITPVAQALFEAPFSSTTPLRSYDVTPDGQFTVNLQESGPAQPVSTLHVVIGWAGVLTTRVTAG